METLRCRSGDRKGDNGRWRSECSLPSATLAPLCRALMRVEARLLREDANRLTEDWQSWRTPAERRDALVALILEDAVHVVHDVRRLTGRFDI